MQQPFSGLKILDLTHVIAGPFCTYQLAVLGADVVKIEHPTRNDQVRETGGNEGNFKKQKMGFGFMTNGSNKRCITLDLSKPEGVRLFRKMARTADVVVENYRAGAMSKLGIGYEHLSPENPSLIYCSLTGFGQTGPKAEHTAYDMVIQAVSGIMTQTGTPEVSPLKLGAPVVDYSTGLTAAYAIAAALVQRERNGGKGQKIDVSMLDTTLVFLGAAISRFHYGGSFPATPRGNDYTVAGGSCYQAKDGLIMIGALNPRQHERLWQTLGRPDIAARSSYREQEELTDEHAAELKKLFLTRTAEEWERLLNDNTIPAGRVRSVAEALSLDHIKSRDSLTHTHQNFPKQGESLTVPVASFSFAEAGPKVTSPPGRLGQDTDDVLKEYGIGDEEIRSMRSEGVI